MASSQQMDSRSVSQLQNVQKQSQSDLKITQSHKIIEQQGKRYMKIRYNTKQQLQSMVQRQGMKIKDAALILGMEKSGFLITISNMQLRKLQYFTRDRKGKQKRNAVRECVDTLKLLDEEFHE